MATSSSKRPASPQLIANPCIKRKNLQWTLHAPSSSGNEHGSEGCLEVDAVATAQNSDADANPPGPEPRPTAAAVESGAIALDDHLAHFSDHLAKVAVGPAIGDDIPRLSIRDYASLYTAHAGSPNGAHFVIHQHDHPIAGTHYDLRLQINETSSVSWAIMYGLPGDPNSVKLNRNATETRIHSLWNHLIETASPDTGSLMIWDTGTYSVLPRRSKYAPAVDPDSGPSEDEADGAPVSTFPATQQSLLHAAFQTRKMKIRLHGSKLPDPYVIQIRLTRKEDAAGRAKASRTKKSARRRRGGVKTAKAQLKETSPSSSNEHHDFDAEVAPPTNSQLQDQDVAIVSALEKELRELEDDEVRGTNAYTGASNSIGSVHQRQWYLSIDRYASGMVPTRQDNGRTVWHFKSSNTVESGSGTQFSYPFYVRGRDHERSVVTGRLGAEILCDEGVVNFVPRMGWKPVVS